MRVSYFCYCCVCRGRRCLAPHPGHDHNFPMEASRLAADSVPSGHDEHLAPPGKPEVFPASSSSPTKEER